VSGVCAACGASALTHHWTVKRAEGASLAATTTAYRMAYSDIVRCNDCGHLQVARFPAEPDLDRGYEEVAEAAYLDEEAGQRATARRALQRIERHVGHGALCDLGCWAGFLLSEAQRRGWESWGVEPSPFAVHIAADRFGLSRVQHGTIHSAELPDGRFQAVVMGDVIEHLPDPGAALERVTRLLAPDGVLYLALPDAGSRIARVLGARWWSVLPTHVQYFTRVSIAALLQRHGYRIEWIATAPKTFSVRYYLERLQGYSEPIAAGAVAGAERLGLAGRQVSPDFRDRMALVARRAGA
jgi:SAM-dependent methyltransferase